LLRVRAAGETLRLAISGARRARGFFHGAISQQWCGQHTDWQAVTSFDSERETKPKPPALELLSQCAVDRKSLDTINVMSCRQDAQAQASGPGSNDESQFRPR